MKIVNFQEFLGFADEMSTRYKFYRIVGDKLQAFMVGRDGMIIHSELVKPDQKAILDVVNKGFIETELTKDEIETMGLE